MQRALRLPNLERGVRRNGQLIAADIHEYIAQIRTMAQHEGLSQSCLERIDKAERVVPKMQATIEVVSGYVRQQVARLDVTPPAVSCWKHLAVNDRIVQTTGYGFPPGRCT